MSLRERLDMRIHGSSSIPGLQVGMAADAGLRSCSEEPGGSLVFDVTLDACGRRCLLILMCRAIVTYHATLIRDRGSECCLLNVARSAVVSERCMMWRKRSAAKHRAVVSERSPTHPNEPHQNDSGRQVPAPARYREPALEVVAFDALGQRLRASDPSRHRQYQRATTA
jgi:hypothetical protein